MILRWARIEDANGPEALHHKNSCRNWTPEERYELVARMIAGESNLSAAVDAGISSG